MNDPGRVLILGAGPTGLGAAYRLQELGVSDHEILEARSAAGGLAGSHVDARGFTWDTGGHVQFSHYGYYDDLLDRALGDAWLHHERESWIWIKGRFVPYPLQNNIHRLDPDDRERALRGLEEAARVPRPPSSDFRSWIETTFGDGLARLFMIPYNTKVWGYPPEALGVRWMGERVAIPDLERIRRTLRDGRDDVSWGPNNQFRFPLRGGTGAIWTGVANLLDPSRLLFDTFVSRVDLDARTVTLADGRRLRYDTLISTLPLDVLCERSDGLAPEVRRAGRSLVHSSCHIVGIGLRGGQPETLERKCWMYFPEAHSPYYRVTVFSHYSPYNVPPGDGYWSLMAEVCETATRPVDGATLCDRTLKALRVDGLVPPSTEVVSLWHRREEHGYPTPFLGREKVLAVLRPSFEARRVFSRGRFGAWVYEVSNQDHSCMQGVEVVDRLLGIGEETTIDRPDHVNGGGFLRRARQ